jgi:hypothetical protein
LEALVIRNWQPGCPEGIPELFCHGRQMVCLNNGPRDIETGQVSAFEGTRSFVEFPELSVGIHVTI